jgi:hypothetical protein
VASSLIFLLAKSKNKLGSGAVESEGGKRTLASLAFIFTRQTRILLAFGYLVSGYLHPCV